MNIGLFILSMVIVVLWAIINKKSLRSTHIPFRLALMVWLIALAYGAVTVDVGNMNLESAFILAGMFNFITLMFVWILGHVWSNSHVTKFHKVFGYAFGSIVIGLLSCILSMIEFSGYNAMGELMVASGSYILVIGIILLVVNLFIWIGDALFGSDRSETEMRYIEVKNDEEV